MEGRPRCGDIENPATTRAALVAVVNGFVGRFAHVGRPSEPYCPPLKEPCTASWPGDDPTVSRAPQESTLCRWTCSTVQLGRGNEMGGGQGAAAASASALKDGELVLAVCLLSTKITLR